MHAVVALQQAAFFSSQLRGAIVAAGLILGIVGGDVLVRIKFCVIIDGHQDRVDGIKKRLNGFFHRGDVCIDRNGCAAFVLNGKDHALDNVAHAVGVGFHGQGPVVHRKFGVGRTADIPVGGRCHLTGNARPAEGINIVELEKITAGRRQSACLQVNGCCPVRAYQ